MNAAQVDALREAAADGIDFDGFAARTEGEGYALQTAAGSGTVVHESGLADAAEEYRDYVTNWHFWHAEAPQADDRWTFLRWLERADELPVPERYEALRRNGPDEEDRGAHALKDSSGSRVAAGGAGMEAGGTGTEAGDAGTQTGDAGIVRTWGQLRVAVTVDADGVRRYDLRHEADADTPADDLTAHADPLDAREIAKRDDRERYRPLKTAPTLRTGWHFPDLGPEALVRAVDFFYPATVANWHREREGDLDVTHWRDAMARQTGIYGVVQTWNRGEGHDHVDWVAEACCVDSQCLKRREWQYDDETDLDVDGGDGEFPCREPCSLVVSAARRWTKLEGEESRTYEFELTPSEKEQVEAIIDAVADGSAADVREADFRNPANRYRARFLRAKRFDDDGNLSGVPTTRDEMTDDETDEEADDAGVEEGNADADGDAADADQEDSHADDTAGGDRAADDSVDENHTTDDAVDG